MWSSQLLHTVRCACGWCGSLGHHARPASERDVVHAAAGSLVTDGILSLLLELIQNEQGSMRPACSGVADRILSLIQLLHGLLQVNDTQNTITLQ